MTKTGWYRPGIRVWKGTPIPAMHMPLEPSPRRVAIAEAAWWNGPAWTILRNGPQFVRQVLDFGNDDEIAFMCRDVAREVWVAALNEARLGRMSRQAFIFWSIRLGLKPIDYACDWPRDAHFRDIRPLAGATREQMYERHRAWRERAAATRANAVQAGTR